MRNGNKPIDCLLWYPRGAILFLSQTIPTSLSLRHLLLDLFRHVNQAKSVEYSINIRHTSDISQSLGSVHDLSDFTDIVIRQDYGSPSKAVETVFEKAGKKITPKLLLEAIRTLPEEKRKAILLYYFEGMNDTEIAELFNTSRSTIQYRRTSSFEKLRKYLEENADEWDEW